MTSALTELFKHNLWANLRLLDVCAQLDETGLDATVTGTYGSIRDTFVHLVAAEDRYVALLNDRTPEHNVSERKGFPGWEQLREHTRLSGEGLIAMTENFDPSRILRGIRGGEPYEMPAVVPIVQSLNHATEHRVQIATILTQHGVEPPTLDGWQYSTEELGVE